MYACLAVTCHLHFWQNDRDLLRATVVTRGWNGYRNKSQHRKSTLEKKILPPFQQRFEPATFQSRVRRSNHWAIPAPSCSWAPETLYGPHTLSKIGGCAAFNCMRNRQPADVHCRWVYHIARCKQSLACCRFHTRPVWVGIPRCMVWAITSLQVSHTSGFTQVSHTSSMGGCTSLHGVSNH